MSESFFQTLTGFADFNDAANLTHYSPVPADWFILLTDVEASTKAIEAGRYKDVNMAGAACITAVVNSCKPISIPYVFGGDGATLLIPPSCLEPAKLALLSLKRAVLEAQGLSLRVGIVPVSEITRRGKQILVAKYVMPTGCALAMFAGGGAGLADQLVKNEGFTVHESEEVHTPDLAGLSCRWQPIDSQQGTILTLLVMQTGGDDHIYPEIVTFISRTLADMDSANPVLSRHMRYKWPGLKTLRESKLVWSQGKKLKNLIDHVFWIAFFNLLNRFKIKLEKFDIVKYRKELALNSDYRKFDDMLRMVLDCTPKQTELIESYLEGLYASGRIVFGTHHSASALMTCFVTSVASDGHVHFIDGDGGGYALAAKKMKERLALKIHNS